MKIQALVSLLAIGLGSSTGIKDVPLDLELKQADVVNIYRLLSDVAEKKFELDPCVHGAVDLNLKNAPVTLVLEALASKLHVTYDDDGTVIHVLCAPPAGASELAATKVTLAEKGAPLNEVLARLATSSHLDGVDYRAKAQPSIAMTLPPVRLSTALTALSDASGVKVTISKNRLLASD